MALDQVIIKEREDKLRSLNLDPNEILRKLNQDTLPSIEKIDEAVEYFKNELGFESKQFQRLPALFNLSIKYNLSLAPPSALISHILELFSSNIWRLVLAPDAPAFI